MENEIKFNNTGKVSRLTVRQFLPITLDEAWAFFSSPRNLATITPNYLKFIILSGAETDMYAGQIIQYKVQPLPFYTSKWVTEIKNVQDKKFFIDEQRYGPYDLWHHKHFFKAVSGGVEMTDIVDYKLPLGVLGRIVEPFLVRPKLREIFLYRKNKLVELFGKIN